MPALDPPGSNALSAAVGWLHGTLLGTVATAIAIIAVAAVGLLMLSGRIDVRRAARVIFGCFIIFGASTIAGGILSAVRGGSGGAELAQAPPPPPPLAPPPAVQRVPSTPYDPYAGAAVPQR